MQRKGLQTQVGRRLLVSSNEEKHTIRLMRADGFDCNLTINKEA